MIVLLCCFKFNTIVLKAEQATRDWQSKQDKYATIRRRKDEESEAKERMLVSDIYIVWIKRSSLL
jgi:head-tail adaptor